ncbi:MAG TPA: LysR family transcriptional regulator [Verrucomicrobiae bacterium]|nr:LysR family transcriptional regulator [Verrucomicrobiae bacterium]
MNIHHVELFYYVAKHGGVTEATRRIPYGIQQPAVSGQVSQLEEYLGMTLFQRRPFKLTTEGKKLYEFVAPFFSNLEKVANELQGGHARHIRVGASNIILREHLPELFQSVQKKFPETKMSLREGIPAQLEELLRREEIDIAVTLIEHTPSEIHSLPLLELPIVLLVEKDSPIKSADELWRRDKIVEPLICLPREEPLCKNFQQWLERRNVDWLPGIEASSAELIAIYVSKGLGIGVSVPIPKKPLPPNVRALPLNDFPPVVIGVLWHGVATPLIKAFLDEAKKRAKQYK